MATATYPLLVCNNVKGRGVCFFRRNIFGADGIDRARGMVFVIEFRVASNAQG